jgi:hypothetical protein
MSPAQDLQQPSDCHAIWISSLHHSQPQIPSSRFLFCPEDEIGVLLVVIPRPVKRPTLLLDLPRRLLLVLEFARLDFVPLPAQEALLESFRGSPNSMPFRKLAMVSILPSRAICS